MAIEDLISPGLGFPGSVPFMLTRGLGPFDADEDEEGMLELTLEISQICAFDG